MAVSGEETQIARGENIELEAITVTVHFRIMTVSATATTSIALRDKKGLFCHEQSINHFTCNEAAGITKTSRLKSGSYCVPFLIEDIVVFPACFIYYFKAKPWLFKLWIALSTR